MGLLNWWCGNKTKEEVAQCQHDWEVKEFPAVGMKLLVCRICQETLLDLHGSLWKRWQPEPGCIESLATQEGNGSCPLSAP